MGKGSLKVLNSDLNVKKLIELLNAALAEEWLAYYQYWIGAQVIVGTMRAEIKDEFLEHAEDELEHANWIATRIIQLGGTPVLNPKEWDKLARCKFDAPMNFDSVVLLQQNTQSEECAMIRYQEIADFTDGKDYITCELAKKILAVEAEHEQDLTDYTNDINMARKTYK